MELVSESVAVANQLTGENNLLNRLSEMQTRLRELEVKKADFLVRMLYTAVQTLEYLSQNPDDVPGTMAREIRENLAALGESPKEDA